MNIAQGRGTRAFIIGSIVVAVLTGCATTASQLSTGFKPVTPTPTVSAAPQVTVATVASLPIGAPLPATVAVAIRKNPPANGDYAYQLPDKSWIKISTKQPLPANVIADQQGKANAVQKPTNGMGYQQVFAVRDSADAFLGEYTFATGRNAVYVYQGTYAVAGQNVPCWQVSGTPANQLGVGMNHWPSSAAAVAAAKQLIASSSTPNGFDIVVEQ
ncbi:hypothetical protein [Curtobacterium sp. MCBD17_040]|uniref:hypothetical protein n=1 Tax=Curtobacterium sp. MCBD17_040 TaxID=2175674 RepID=UPI000DAA5D69|nr:hypothetical protein [Curtobacterium sp. MCBD17_040]WIB65486.1 hypothetical protein DEI94_19120 [Curtobacterium sp. MCBD17_040]